MAYTKEELISALEKAIGGTAKGQEIINLASKIFDEHGEYSQDLRDRLDESIGAYAKLIERDASLGEDKDIIRDSEHEAIVAKALDVLNQLNK